MQTSCSSHCGSIVLPRALYGAEVAQFSKRQNDNIRIFTLDTLRPSLKGKRRHRDLALNLLYYDTPVELGTVWFLYCARNMRTHADRHPQDEADFQLVWRAYLDQPKRSFGPVHSLWKATARLHLTPCPGGVLATTEGSVLDPLHSLTFRKLTC